MNPSIRILLARGSQIGRIALVAVLLAPAWVGSAHAAWPDDDVSQVVEINFDKSDMNADPQIIGNSLRLIGSTSTEEISVPGAIPLTIESAIPRSSPRFTVQGPWRIGYDTTLSQAELEGALLGEEKVLSIPEEPVPHPVIGESAASEFPDLSLNHFYDASQKMLHVMPTDPNDVHPEDPSYWDGNPFGDYDMDLPQAWAITKGSPDVVVAVVDVGVNTSHPELVGQILNTDPIGDQNGDGCPGDCFVDDDGDGIVDEDHKLRGRANIAELDVRSATFDSGQGTSVTIDSNDPYSIDELIGWVLWVIPEDMGFVITSNDSTTDGLTWVTTNGAPLGDWGSLPTRYREFGALKLGDGLDSDLDGIVDDLGWDPSFAYVDDDENGYFDDYQGWDFVGRDNNVENLRQNHGTGIAGLIAGTFNTGAMAGIAPNVKILPIKTDQDAVVCGQDGHAFLTEEIVEYCAGKGVDILSTSVKDGNADAAQTATDVYGMIHTNGSGNGAQERMTSWGNNPRSLIVAGTEPGGWLWFNEEEPDPYGSNWHARVDLGAGAVQFGPVGGECGPTPPVSYTSWEGTSFSGPAVAGILALMKSAYPHWDNDFIRAKLRASTVPYEPFGVHPVRGQQTGSDGTTDMTQYEGKLGTGVANAYRALTFYGDLFPPEPVVFWSDTVYVSGDLTIPAGQELVIEPGTTIRIAQDDILDGGIDPRIVEWVVDGTLTAIGTPLEPIVFEILADDPADFLPGETLDHNPEQLWGHFKLATLDNATLENVEFRDVIPRDFLTGVVPSVAVEGDTVSTRWSTDHIFATHAPTIQYEDSVRVSISLDGGATFGPSSIVPVEDGQHDWIVPGGVIGNPIMVRAEFLDPNGYVIGYDDLDEGALRIIQPISAFVNVSDQTGITIPQGSVPYGSVPVDYDSDGDEDLVISYENLPAQLNRNGGDTGDIASFTNVATTSLGDGDVGNTKGVNRIDYDNNGAVDLFFASTTGSRLFEGDRANLGDLTNETTTLLGAAANAASLASAWGDYNADGYMDAYIIADVSDMLLESEIGSSGGFTDVTTAAGLHTETDETTSAMWAHLTSDGYLDLFVGWGGTSDENSPTLAWSPYYINDGDDGSGQVTFADKAGASAGPRIGYLGNIHAVDFADLSGDGQLDIVLARQNSSGGDGFGNLVTCLNDGYGAMIEEGVALGIHTDTPMADVEVSDVDGNGVPDIFGLPSDGTAVQLFTGHGEQASRGYWNATTAAALGSGTTYGIATADFNGDADHDVFLLRPETGSNPEDRQFMWANPLLTEPAAPGSEITMTVGFDVPIESLGMPNASGLGAKVTVAVETPSGEQLLSAQVMDGGSGRGSQGSDRLAFGLAGATTAQIKVRWPHGATQIFDAASMPGFPNVTIHDTHDPLIDNSTVTSSYVSNSSSAQHTFVWWTELPGGEPQVQLSLSGRPTSTCTVPLGDQTSLLLDPDDPGVSATSEKVDSVWRHQVVWNAYCGAPCTYTYIVRNNVGGTIYSANAKTHYVGICADIYQP